MRQTRLIALAHTLLALMALGGCVAFTSTSPNTSAQEATGLGCTFSSNCVNSLGGNGLPPLRYSGTSAQAMAALQATLATFPEAQMVRSGDLGLTSIFTTSVGFKDDVEFKIDPQSRRIDFRSKSMVGLYDFGKNRSRMQDFAARFEKQPAK